MDNAIRRIFGVRSTRVAGGLESCGPPPREDIIAELAPEITGYLQRPSLTTPECVRLHALINQAAEGSDYARERGDEAQARRIDDWAECVNKIAETKCPVAYPQFSLIDLIDPVKQMLSGLTGKVCYRSMGGDLACIDSNRFSPGLLAYYIIPDYENYGRNLLGQGIPYEKVREICRDGVMHAAQSLRAQAHGRQ